MVIVIDPPRFDLLACIFDRFELHHVRAHIAQSPIERLDMPVFSGFSGMDEVELHASPIRPFLEHFRRELRAVIDTGVPARSIARSKAATTSQPPSENRDSSNGV
jgi:hypothetical protein